MRSLADSLPSVLPAGTSEGLNRDKKIHHASHFLLWGEEDMVSEEEHAAECQGGYLTVRDGKYEQLLPCPICKTKNARDVEMKRAEANIERSGIGKRYLALEWDDLELLEPLPRVKTGCDKITQIIEAGHSLLLYGAPGGGKTAAAVLAVKSAIRAGHTAQIHNLGRLASEIRGGYNGSGLAENDVVKDLSAVDLLALDDIGAGETANAEVEKRILYLIMEARQNGGKPTIVTTNLSQSDLVAAVGVRIMNRSQPLTTLAFKHGKNFRLKSQSEVLW